jgi:hypothetical protein
LATILFREASMATERHSKPGDGLVHSWQRGLPSARRGLDGVYRVAPLALLATSGLGLGGCRAVEAVFKVGMWFGILIVVAIVAVVGGVLAMALKKK